MFEFSVKVSRNWEFYGAEFLATFVPFVLTLCVFAMASEDVSDRLGYMVGLLLTVSISAPTRAYSTILDRYRYACLIYLATATVYCALVGALDVNTNRSRARVFIFAGFVVFFLAIHALFLSNAMRLNTKALETLTMTAPEASAFYRREFKYEKDEFTGKTRFDFDRQAKEGNSLISKGRWQL